MAHLGHAQQQAILLETGHIQSLLSLLNVVSEHSSRYASFICETPDNLNRGVLNGVELFLTCDFHIVL
jgi:hypothetical protein